MKWLLLAVIKLYWFFIPEKKRRACLYKESCSKYVYRNTLECGLVKGLKCLLHRFKTCNPHHEVIYLATDNTYVIRLKTGEFLQEDDCNNSLLPKLA